MKKILICGLGSIGQRHVRNLQNLFGKKIELACYRTRGIDVVLNDQMKAIHGNKPEYFYKLIKFIKIDEAMSWSPDVVFITNPIYLHIQTAITAAKKGAHLFIEKPLDSSNSYVDELMHLVVKKKLVCMLGYQLRYHPAYIRIKELVQYKKIGQLITAQMHFGEYLPGMHPYEDYRTSHASIDEQGGGAILCLSHEIDLAYWLFGMPETVYTIGGHYSNLEINVEDSVDIILGVNVHKKIIPINIHLDFIQEKPQRKISIIGTDGRIEFDYFNNCLEISVNGFESEKIIYEHFQRNDMFTNELVDFMNCIDEGREPPIPLKEGIDVLEICLAAKRSLESKNIQQLKVHENT